jgi:hypothetical protein
MKPKELVERWVVYFNKNDIESLSLLYSDHAVNHQVANVPVEGERSNKKNV